MNLNVTKVKQTLDALRISKNDFSIKFGIHRSYLYNVLNGTVVAGRKFFAAWAKFCNLFELNFIDYFDFDDN